MKEYELKRISTTDISGNIRDIPAVGTAWPPRVGSIFTIVCDPVVEGSAGRMVTTSVITKIDGNTFTTRSGSVYEFKEL